MPTRRSAWVLTALLLIFATVPRAAANDAALDPAQDLTKFSPELSAMVDHCRAATVGIVIPGGSMGSGVIINEQGLILTAAHVLPEDGKEIVIVLSDGRQLAGKSLGVNRKADSGMAMIAEPGSYPFAEIAERDTVWEGDWCVAFGHGGGVQTDRPAPMRLGRALHISSSTRPIRFITTDCTVISGDSGGPLFDLQGKVIGIHSNIGMSVLVNRHVPINAYHAQWDKLLEPGEINEPPSAAKPLFAGLDALPDSIVRAIERRLSEGDAELEKKLNAFRDDAGRVKITPEQAAEMLDREDLLQEVRAYQEKIAERERRTQQIEGADAGGVDPKDESGVSKQLRETRALILQKKRERMLDDIAEDLRRTHGKIAEHVLSRFEPAVSAAGPSTVEVICRNKVVSLGTIVRDDGYIVTKASELVGPPKVRLGDKDYRARVLKGDRANDLVLLKIDAEGLVPVRWATQIPAIGALLVTPSPAGKPLAMSVVGVDARPIPQSVNNLIIAPPAKPYLGVGGFEAVEDNGGLKLGSVIDDGPAATAGIQAGDIITAVGETTIENAKALIEIINAAEIGQALALTIQRGDETLELEITLGERPAQPKPEKADDSQSAAQVYSARGGKLSSRRTKFPAALTHDAVIWAGDVGGPLVNLNGEAVGINIARYGRTATYALPADQARQAIEKLMHGR